jgi:hypothetical protein
MQGLEIKHASAGALGANYVPLSGGVFGITFSESRIWRCRLRETTQREILHPIDTSNSQIVQRGAKLNYYPTSACFMDCIRLIEAIHCLPLTTQERV